MTMDAQRMHALACQYTRERTEARLEEALDAALPLCGLIARRFSFRGGEYDDLFQTACLACVQAIRGFDPAKGYQFTTYVTPTITGAVRNHLRDKESLLRTPRVLRERYARMARAREDYYARHHEEPAPRQLAEAMGWTVEMVLSTLAANAANSLLSLDQQDEDGLSLADRLFAPEGDFERMEQREDLRRSMENLNETEQELLRLRFTLRLSQRDAAKRMNRTQMQISRMERRVLAALRKEMEPES